MPQTQLNNLTTGQYFPTLLPLHLNQHKVLTKVMLLRLLCMHARADQSYCTSVQCPTCSRASYSLCSSKQMRTAVGHVSVTTALHVPPGAHTQLVSFTICIFSQLHQALPGYYNQHTRIPVS